MSLDDASRAQVEAADPTQSTWLSANAGSGKTRVLTDRVARLLLGGVDPQNVLCLTYTKAAASEMQNRLFRSLGDWAMMEDEALGVQLSKLGEDALSQDRLAKARRLFARAIETPGGLRIQTIHSFCSAILRRFPLEARISPQFVEMDERTTRLLCSQVVDEMSEGPHAELVTDLGRYLSTGGLSDLIDEILKHREVLVSPPDRAEVFAQFGLSTEPDRKAAMQTVATGSEADLVATLKSTSAGLSKMYLQFIDDLASVNFSDITDEDFAKLRKLCLYSGETRSKSANFPQSNHKAAQQILAPYLPDIHDLMDRVSAAAETLLAIDTAQRTFALRRFASVFLPAYAAAKAGRGWLDFDDLILGTRQLLSDPAVANWVLYRLDGGLDHILVDEAQDTSPAQWDVIRKLASEMTAGEGARADEPRTIFVVGDPKQSIYSFQGADPAKFAENRDYFAANLAEPNTSLRDLELIYSFRSAQAILSFVDATVSQSTMRHRAYHSGLPGRVDLWPMVPTPQKPEDLHWTDPSDISIDEDGAVVLARAIATRLKSMIGVETLFDQKANSRRTIRAGDIMILVRGRRGALFAELIRQLKVAGIPVAGADRLRLGDELAVKDIVALLSFLATPEDDLSLATALRSPLFGWSEAQLHELAYGRGDSFLWQELRKRRDDFAATLAVIDDLRGQADYLRPFELIERILTRHDGRRRLAVRLGPEAEDGIDALLPQALAYERLDVPSLTGFLHWLEAGEVELKRQMDNAGDQVRVMTVHGAKGLEAPIVVLPQTSKPKSSRTAPLISCGGDLVWKPRKEDSPGMVLQADAEREAAEKAENERLFYVAATRAENWLIVAGTGDAGNEPSDSWHARAQAGLQGLGAVPLDTPTGEGLRYETGDWDAGEVDDKPDTDELGVVLPDWATRRPGAPVVNPGPITPTGLGGAKALPSEDGFDQDAALAHGTRLHRLLELMPEAPADQWKNLAQRVVFAGDEALDPTTAQRAIDEASRVLSNPDLGWIFAPGSLSEVEITAPLPTLAGRQMFGVIDRLIVNDDRVRAVDFKTNVAIPGDPAEVPEGILRQMGAYLEALEQVYPDRAVDVAILWTNTADVMVLPHDIVRAALARSTIA